MKRVLSFMLVCAILASVVLVGSVSAFAAANSGAVGNNIKWSYANKTLTISGSGKMTLGTATPPWNGLDITAVVIGEGVTFFDSHAFKDLPDLKKLTLPLSLEPVTPQFSSKVSSLDIYYAGNNADWAYIKNGNITIKTKMHYAKEVVDLNTTGKVGKNAYWTLESDGTTVVISGTGAIDANTYGYAWNCPTANTKTVKIKEGITAIGVRAFAGFDKLTKVELPKSLQIIGNNAFDECTNLTNITYSGTKADWGKIQIYENAKFATVTMYYAGDRTTENKRDPNAVDVFVNGIRIEAYQPAIIVNGSTMVPLRAICEALKCDVNWNPNTKTAQIQNQATIISVQIGNNILAKVDRADQTNVIRVEIPNPPILYNNSTLVPARAISEALYADVQWDASTRSVYITLEYDSIGFYSDGIAVAQKGDKFGIVNENREVVLPFEYSEIVLPDAKRSTTYNKYRYIMVRDSSGKCGIVDNTGKIIVRPQYAEIIHGAGGIIIDDCEYIMVRHAVENKLGYIDLKGKVAIPLKYDNVLPFVGGLAAVEQNGKWGYINKSGAMVIQSLYSGANSFVGNYAVVKKTTKWGTIDKKGKIVIPLVYDKIFDDFSDGFSIVQNEGKFGAIDNMGYDAIYGEGNGHQLEPAGVEIKLTFATYEAARQALLQKHPHLRATR